MSQTVSFTKLGSDGQALGYWENKALFVTGLLPDETAEVRITRNKKTWANGEIEKITSPSSHRHEPKEAHFLSCSPWQGVDYDYQVQLKRHMLAEMFGRPELGLEVADFVAAPAPFGYRNKLEFTIQTDPYGVLSLTFHARGSFNELVPAHEGCVLGSDRMNRVATKLLGRMQELDLADYADTLTVRESQSGRGVVAVLLLKTFVNRDWEPLKLGRELAGVAVVTKGGNKGFRTVWSDGTLELTEIVGGVPITYPWDGFFQVNVPTFDVALAKILEHIPSGSRVVDLYGGAGTIGLPVALQAESVLGVEVVASSVELARRNATSAGISNYEAVLGNAELMDPALLLGADIVIVDPPRAGLHPRVIDYLAESKPAKIIYLSCNPSTQVRDVVWLAKEGYSVGQPIGFDFYPGTLHLESLVVLERAV